MKKKILVLCATQRDIRELARKIFDQYTIIFEETSRNWLEQLCQTPDKLDLIDKKISAAIEYICSFVRNNAIDAIVSTCDYPANIMRAAINERLQLLGPSLKSIFMHEHKYYSRLLQMQIVPHAVPFFTLINSQEIIRLKKIIFPQILKPVKSNFSKNTIVVYDTKEFFSIVPKIPLSSYYLRPFNYFLKYFSDFEYDGGFILAENFIQGYQTTVEGFVINGNVTILGVVDSVFFPNTISFKRFEYPSNLEHSVQERMMNIAKKVILASELNYSLFNVECIYNPKTDEVFIIEINPRLSSQFADLFDRVDGFNTYQIMIDLALGNVPKIQRNNGKFNVAASCVLRFFEDKHVVKIPSASNIKKIKELFPDVEIEIYAQPGKKLSHEEQDAISFRYGLINMGAFDRQDLFNRFEICKALLDFRFKHDEQ
jgi:biotin carboxylase